MATISVNCEANLLYYSGLVQGRRTRDRWKGILCHSASCYIVSNSRPKCKFEYFAVDLLPITCVYCCMTCSPYDEQQMNSFTKYISFMHNSTITNAVM